MKTMRQNEKALSPVVASIILIAVTVAVSVLTCGWLGAIAANYTGTAEITVENIQFTGTAGQPTNIIILSLKNIGTKTTTIEMVKINGNSFSFNTPTDENTTYVPTETKDLTVNNVGWQTGSGYDIEIYGDEASIVGAYRANSLGT